MSMRSPLTLVTGPARSGKSEWAEHLADQSGRSVIYIATAQIDPTDRDWQQRIAQHQARRPPTWQTYHEPVALAERLPKLPADHCLLVDSLGTWLANRLEEDEPTWQVTIATLLHSLQTTQAPIILVAEETGWGVVPAYPIGRTFRDRLGMATRQIGAIAESVYLVTAGYAVNLRAIGTPVPYKSDPSLRT